MKNILIIISCLLNIIIFCKAIPLNRVLNITRDDITNPELLPPDHVPAAHIEHDGDVNKDYHHEAFLGTLVKEGKLKFGNMRGYHTLIDVFHHIDRNQDHLVDQKELTRWIHDRINEHYYAAVADSQITFKKIDTDKDGTVVWAEYKAVLVGMNQSDFLAANVSSEKDEASEFSKEAIHWKKADFNKDGRLKEEEFLAFIHPEHNKETVKHMAEEMMPGMDRNDDKKISLEEFTYLPPGEVSEEEKHLDIQYIEDRKKEFINDMDFDSDGFVTIDELTRLLDPRHKQHAIKEADYLIRIADRSRDHRLSEREMLMNYALFTGSSVTNYARLHDEF